MVAFSLAVYLIKNHIQIDFKSLLKKGFPKKDNDFGLYCYTGKQGKGKTYTCMKFLINYKINYPECIILTNVKSFSFSLLACVTIKPKIVIFFREAFF